MKGNNRELERKRIEADVVRKIDAGIRKQKTNGIFKVSIRDRLAAKPEDLVVLNILKTMART